MHCAPTRGSGGTRSIRAELERTLEAHAHAVLRSSAVPPLTKALCGAMVAALTYCTPLLIEHRKAARELGAGAQMLTDLWNNATSESYTDAQRAALAAAVALTREPRALPPAVREALERQYDAEQIYEIVCAIGLENYRSRLRNALNV